MTPTDLKSLLNISEKIIIKEDLVEAINILSNVTVNSSDLKKDICTQKIKSFISNSSCNLGTFISNKENLSVLNKLSNFNFYDKENSVKVCKQMIESSYRSFDFLEHMDFIDSIDSIYDAINEISRMTFKSFPSKNSNDSSYKAHSDVFHDQYMFATSHYEVMLNLANKPYGYYLFCINSLSRTNVGKSHYRNEYHVISHQESGIFVAEIFNFEKTSNFAGAPSVFVSPFFEKNKVKNHKKNDSNVSNIKNKDSLFFHHNQPTLLGISFIVSMIHNQRKELFNFKPEVNLINFNKKETNSTEVATVNHIEKNINYFTLDDLKFTGEYECLSFLDELFSDILQKHIDYINFSRENCADKVYVIWSTYGKDISHLTIKELVSQEQVHGYRGNHSILKPIPSSMLSVNEAEGIERYKMFAIQNKLSLISFYLSNGGLDYQKGIKELQELSLENIDNYIELMKNKIEISKLTEKTTLSLSGTGNKFASIFNSKNKVLIQENYKEIKSKQKDVNVKNYLNKANASNVIYFEIGTVEEILKASGKKVIDDLPYHLKILAKFSNASEKLKKFSSKNNLKEMSISNIDYDISRPELVACSWSSVIEICVPVTKSQLNKFIKDVKYIKRY